MEIITKNEPEIAVERLINKYGNPWFISFVAKLYYLLDTDISKELSSENALSGKFTHFMKFDGRRFVVKVKYERVDDGSYEIAGITYAAELEDETEVKLFKHFERVKQKNHFILN